VLLLIAVSYVVWMYAYPMAYSKPDQVLPYRILASSKNFNELTSVLGSLREQGSALDLGTKSSNAKTLWVLARIPADLPFSCPFVNELLRFDAVFLCQPVRVVSIKVADDDFHFRVERIALVFTAHRP